MKPARAGQNDLVAAGILMGFVVKKVLGREGLWVKLVGISVAASCCLTRICVKRRCPGTVKMYMMTDVVEGNTRTK
jgi:hypothetical protein